MIGGERTSGSTNAVYRNHNVILVLLMRSFDSISSGIWNGATLAAFIYMVQGNSNKSVGIAEGIFGTFCAAAGIPLGWLADRYRRDHTLRGCSVVMLGESSRFAVQSASSHTLVCTAARALTSLCSRCFFAFVFL